MTAAVLLHIKFDAALSCIDKQQLPCLEFCIATL